MVSGIKTSDKYQDFLSGVKSVSGFGISTLMFGLMFGIAGTSAGLSKVETFVMSALVFSASAQFASLEVWHHPGALATILLASALISARHCLLGLTLVHHIRGHSIWSRLFAMGALTDPNAIATIRLSHIQDTTTDRLAFFLGGAAILYVAWLVGTLFGMIFTELFNDDQIEALRFSGILVMITMMVLFAKGNPNSATPWIASGIAAFVLSYLGIHPHWVMPLSVSIGVVVFIIARRFSETTR